MYVLPESYEVKNKTLEDIKYVANPTYSKGDVAKLDKEVKVRWDLGGKKYIPGTYTPHLRSLYILGGAEMADRE